MPAIIFLVETFVISIGAGAFGALLGLGGGVILVPLLTLWLGVDIHYAIGASIVSVIATSSGAAATYLRDGIANIRIAMFLEIGTTTGAIFGAFLAGFLGGPALFIIFAVMLSYSAVAMFRRRNAELPEGVQMGPIAQFLHLNSEYYDLALNRLVKYNVRGARYGLPLMFVAGAVSGLLGIGSGVLKVPAMDMAMRLPMKVSTATSNFMIGVTAAASAGIYFARGDIVPFIAAPVMMGVLIGAMIGTRLMVRARSSMIRRVFVAVMLFVSIQMLAKGFGIGVERAFMTLTPLLIVAAVSLLAAAPAIKFVPRARQSLVFDLVLWLATWALAFIGALLAQNNLGGIIPGVDNAVFAQVPIVPTVVGAVAGALCLNLLLWLMDRLESSRSDLGNVEEDEISSEKENVGTDQNHPG